MTFGEHLEELRRALFKSLIGIFLGCIFGFYFGQDVMNFVNAPLKSALEKYYQQRSIAIADNEGRALTPAQLSALANHQLIVEPVMVEPRDLAAAMAAVIPEEAEKYLRAQRYKFTAAAIIDGDTFAFAKLLDAQKGVAGRLYSMLPQARQQLLKSAAKGNKLSTEEAATIFDSVNNALKAPSFYNAEIFKDVSLSEAIKQFLDRREAKLAEGSDFPAEQIFELNWELLSSAYPTLVAPPQPTLVPVMLWRQVRNDRSTNPQSLGVQEGFMIWMKASFITGFVLASPWVFYQLWMFVGAGLYPHEKKYVTYFLPFSIGLFLLGVWIAIAFVFGPVLEFLFNTNASLGIDPDPRIGEWLSFFLMLPLGFGLAFQLPLVMLFLERIGVLTVETYISKWKIAVMSIVVLACVLTPADPISFLFLGVPMLLLYVGGILLCKWRSKSAPAVSERS